MSQCTPSFPVKMGGRLVRHARPLIFQLSEVSVPLRLFEGVLDRIGGYRWRQAEGEYNHDLAKRESAPGSRLVFNALLPHWRGARRRQRRTRSIVNGKNRIPYRIDRRLTCLSGTDYDATISWLGAGLLGEPALVLVVGRGYTPCGC